MLSFYNAERIFNAKVYLLRMATKPGSDGTHL